MFQFLMNFIVRNRAYFDKISAHNLPTTTTVSSVEIYENCNYDTVQEHLAAPMARILLLDHDDFIVLDPPIEGYELVVPIDMNSDVQNCKIYEVRHSFSRPFFERGPGGNSASQMPVYFQTK